VIVAAAHVYQERVIAGRAANAGVGADVSAGLAGPNAWRGVGELEAVEMECAMYMRERVLWRPVSEANIASVDV
jgi:hypothetical protein